MTDTKEKAIFYTRREARSALNDKYPDAKLEDWDRMEKYLLHYLYLYGYNCENLTLKEGRDIVFEAVKEHMAAALERRFHNADHPAE